MNDVPKDNTFSDEYKSDIAEEEKILKNPFPDRIFTTNIKNKFRCFKVPSAVLMSDAIGKILNAN